MHHLILMKRVLIITYYWPPAGGGGVMRWLKMAKYLPELGWQPVIYTPENPDPSVVDESLMAEIPPEIEVVRQPIWEPYDLFRRLTGKSKESRFKSGYISEASRGSFQERLAVFLRGNLLIPDPRVFWVSPSVKFLREYLREHPVDLVVSTGPPHSMHLIALKLKKYIKVPWLADFRDPWTGIDFYHRLKLTPLSDRIHHRLEKSVLTAADVVTVVSPGMKKSLEALAGREVHVIFNGYDPADFIGSADSARSADYPGPEGSPAVTPAADRFIISHFGAFNRDRNPHTLWQALRELAGSNPDLRKALTLRLIGQTDETILQEVRELGLGEQLEVIPHLEHRRGVELLRESALFLLPLNDSPNARDILPGKMYEYMALGRPILAVGPSDSDCEQILTAAHAGNYYEFKDLTGMKTALEEYFHQWQRGEITAGKGDITRFSRRHLAGEIIRLAIP